MKKYIFVALLIFSIKSEARSIEFIAGGLTYHTVVNTLVTNNFSNRLTSDGKLIYNQLYGFGYTIHNGLEYDSYKFFVGHNSINENIGGASYSFGFTYKNLDSGFLIGMYRQDSDMFSKNNINYLWMSTDYIPLVGFEFNYKIMLTNTKFIKINNYLSPVITNHTLSIGEDF